MPPIALIIICSVFGYIGFREARAFQRKNGQAPWGWDPLIWGGVVFLSVLIGAILLAVARRTTKPPTNWMAPPSSVPAPPTIASYAAPVASTAVVAGTREAGYWGSPAETILPK